MYYFRMQKSDALSSLLHHVSPLIEKAISDGVFDGCVLGLWRKGDAPVVQPWGNYGHGQAMHADSVFDIASVTKSIPVGTLALKRILEGRISLDSNVKEWIPELAVTHSDQVKVWHLLTHSLDYRFSMSSLKHLPPSEIWEKLMRHEFRELPGSSFSYGNAASLILGELLERESGASLPAMANEELFVPLKMKATSWTPLDRHVRDAIVPTEICSWRGREIRGEVHDESAFAFGKPVGSAGVFSSVPDLLRFAAMMLCDGMSLDGIQVVPKGVLGMVTRNALANVPGQGTALGWELANRKFMGEKVSDKAFGKTGFTGASVVCDPACEMAVVLLSNFTWPRREPTVDRIYATRRRVHDALFGAMSNQ